jgi:hypothetical protein
VTAVSERVVPARPQACWELARKQLSVAAALAGSRLATVRSGEQCTDHSAIFVTTNGEILIAAHICARPLQRLILLTGGVQGVIISVAAVWRRVRV